jgi:hypothetical protein
MAGVLHNQVATATEKYTSKEVTIAGVSDDGSSDKLNIHDHIFKNEATAKHWRQIYENVKYEGRHRFDPDYTWTEEEEKKLVRRVRALAHVHFPSFT